MGVCILQCPPVAFSLSTWEAERDLQCVFLFLQGYKSFGIRVPPLGPHLTLITSLKTLAKYSHIWDREFNILILEGHNSSDKTTILDNPTEIFELRWSLESPKII